MDSEKAGDPGVTETAKKWADQTIDLVSDAASLARDVPVDTAKLLLSKLRAAVEAVEKAAK